MVIGPTVIGPTPTESTTLLAGPTLTQCLYDGGNDLTSSTVTMTSTAVEERAAITAAARADVYTQTVAHAVGAEAIAAKKTLNIATGPITLTPLATPVVGSASAAS